MTEDSGPAVAVSLNFAPSFYCKHLGVSYGEEFISTPGTGQRWNAGKVSSSTKSWEGTEWGIPILCLHQGFSSSRSTC